MARPGSIALALRHRRSTTALRGPLSSPFRMEMTLTAGLAVWGAVLSTVVVVRDYWRSRVRARVLVAYGMPPTQGAQESEVKFFAVGTIQNRGRETIVLGAVGIAMDDGSNLLFRPRYGEDPLPKELPPGQAYSVHFDAADAWALSSSAAHRRIRFMFGDQLGRWYYSPYIGTGIPKRTADGWSFSPEPLPRIMTVAATKLRSVVRLPNVVLQLTSGERWWRLRRHND
jgi:hypothetical protein